MATVGPKSNNNRYVNLIASNNKLVVMIQQLQHAEYSVSLLILYIVAVRLSITNLQFLALDKYVRVSVDL
jgi:hypothetical protein